MDVATGCGLRRYIVFLILLYLFFFTDSSIPTFLFIFLNVFRSCYKLYLYISIIEKNMYMYIYYHHHFKHYH